MDNFNGNTDNNNYQNNPPSSDSPPSGNPYSSQGNPPNGNPYASNSTPGGSPYSSNNVPPYGTPGNAYPTYPVYNGGGMPPDGNSGEEKSRGLGALLFSILSIVLCFSTLFLLPLGYASLVASGSMAMLWFIVIFSVLAIVASIIGIVMGVSARKKSPANRRGLGTAALVVGIIGIVFAFITTICNGCVVGATNIAIDSGDLTAVQDYFRDAGLDPDDILQWDDLDIYDSFD